MTRVGKQPVTLPQGVEHTLTHHGVTIRGSRGELVVPLPHWVKVGSQDNILTITPAHASDVSRAVQGTIRQLIQNAVTGVTEGYRRELLMKGTGYRAQVEGTTLVLNVGFSHPVRIDAPKGIVFTVEKNTQITIEGNDKQVVGQLAANIRHVRPPEPYKGKGIRYVDEMIRLKPGKAAKSATAA